MQNLIAEARQIISEGLQKHEQRIQAEAYAKVEEIRKHRRVYALAALHAAGLQGTRVQLAPELVKEGESMDPPTAQEVAAALEALGKTKHAAQWLDNDIDNVQRLLRLHSDDFDIDEQRAIDKEASKAEEKELAALREKVEAAAAKLKEREREIDIASARRWTRIQNLVNGTTARERESRTLRAREDLGLVIGEE